MQTMERALANEVLADRVTRSEALSKTPRPEELERLLQQY
jgi:hypothetical protein